MNTFANALVCLVLLLSTFTATVAESQQGTIIYESKTITQKKGQSLTKVLKKANLTDYQIGLITASAINPKALSERSFRLTYEVSDGNKLLREVLVTRGKTQVNFLVKGSAGKHQLVSGKSQISGKSVKKTIKLSSVESQKSTKKPDVKLTSVSAPLYAVSFVQKRGQKLDKAWNVVNLTAYQQKILKDGQYVKEARSDRHFTLYFDKKNTRQRKLVGMIIVRGTNRVEYTVERAAGGHKLKNLKTVSAKKRQQLLNQFAQADHTYLNKQPKTTATATKQTTPKTPSKTTKKTSKQSAVSGKYYVVRMHQKKGQSIRTAMRRVRLSSIQRELVSKIPVTKSAKSTRYFDLLFERSGKNKYLRAARVTRAGRSAEFALVKHQGKWMWTNNRGQVTINSTTKQSSRGFARYPLRYKRISSHFNLRRRHPITRRIRPHKGTDFAAPHGTPIYAPYKGVVRFAGRQRGYGIILEIDHQNGYRTKYAHLSRISRGLRPGKRVKKGQLIARVGNTGISSGAHLHYEVLVNGRARNPLRVRLPGKGGSSNPLAKKVTLKAGKQAADKYLPILRRIKK